MDYPPRPDLDLTPLHQAAVRPMLQRLGRGYWLLVGGLAALVLLALVAFAVQIRYGKAVGGYSDQVFWGINIANFITIVGMSYGGAVVSAILRLTGAVWRAPLTRIAEATAVVTVFVGGASIIPSVGRADRMWELFTRPNFSSPLVWDVMAIGTYAFASVVFFYLPLIPDLVVAEQAMGRRGGRVRRRLWRTLSWGWRGSPAQHRLLNRSVGLLAIMIIPLAVSVHSVLAWAFTITSFRPWWDGNVWAPEFVVAALYSGIALVILALAGLRRMYHLEQFITERHFVRLGLVLAPFGAAYLYLDVADFLPGAYHGEPATAAVFGAMLMGRYAVWFWLTVLGGLIVPLLIIALPRTRRMGWIVAAAGCVVAALWLKRLIMVVGPASYDMMTGAFGSYHVTWVSASITLGEMAAIPLLLLLVFRVVPILPVTDIEQLASEARSRTAVPASLPASGSGNLGAERGGVG